MTTVMEIQNLTLEYPIPRKYRKEGFTPSGIREISFNVKKGEVVGIIGHNGSGKSTLLKLMAGVFPPDEGRIAIRGSVSLLSGVGVGFHKDLTGRETHTYTGLSWGENNMKLTT